MQQQLPYMDISLVTVALMHLALLYSRDKQQQQQRKPQSLREADSRAPANGPNSAKSSASQAYPASVGNSRNNGNGSRGGGGLVGTQTSTGNMQARNQLVTAEAPEATTSARPITTSPSTSAGSTISSGATLAIPVVATPSGPPASPLASIVRLLVPLVLVDLDGVSGSDLSKVISALSVVRYDNKMVVEQLLQALSLKLVECSAQEVTNVLVALAQIGVQPDVYVRSNIYFVIKHQVARLTPRDLALTMWSYGAMGTDVQEDAVLVCYVCGQFGGMMMTMCECSKSCRNICRVCPATRKMMWGLWLKGLVGLSEVTRPWVRIV